jgi:hypothetical protein
MFGMLTVVSWPGRALSSAVLRFLQVLYGLQHLGDEMLSDLDEGGPATAAPHRQELTVGAHQVTRYQVIVEIVRRGVVVLRRHGRREAEQSHRKNTDE